MLRCMNFKAEAGGHHADNGLGGDEHPYRSSAWLDTHDLFLYKVTLLHPPRAGVAQW